MVRIVSLLLAALIISGCAQMQTPGPASASQSDRCRQLAEMRVNPASRAYVRAWAEEQARAQQCGDAVPAPAVQ
jgi:PBP1b-binding outer membrane lipoprotein LpoB